MGLVTVRARISARRRADVDFRVQVVFVPGEDRDACLLVEAPCLGIACATDDCRAGACEPVLAAEDECAPTRCDDASDCDDRDEETEDSCGREQTCRHVDARDRDGDGHRAPDAGGDDCDDLDPDTHPGASERCDGADGDCDGVRDGTILARTEELSDVAFARVLATGVDYLLQIGLRGAVRLQALSADGALSGGAIALVYVEPRGAPRGRAVRRHARAGGGDRRPGGLRTPELPGALTVQKIKPAQAVEPVGRDADGP